MSRFHNTRPRCLHVESSLRTVFVPMIMVAAGLAGAWLFPAPLFGQGQQQATEANNPELTNRQKDVAERFQNLERLLLRLSEIEAADNPTRAALLQQAAKLGKQQKLSNLLADAASNLGSDQLSDAIDRQKISLSSLESLLKLLQSEDREKRIRNEREQVRRWIEETNRLLRMQGSLRGRTEGGQDLKQAADAQKQLLEKASEIAESISPQSDEEQKAQESDDGSNSALGAEESSDAKNQDADGSPQNNAEKNQSARKSDDKDDEENKAAGKSENDSSENQGDESQSTEESSEGKDDSESKESKGSSQVPSDSSGEPKTEQGQQGEPAKQAQPSEGQGGDPQNPQQGRQNGSPEQQPSPGRQKPKSPSEKAAERYQDAKQRMREAQEALENAKRENAVEKQEQAEEELRAVVEELEQILRQLREEEIERSLASLEDRLRRMLDLQNSVVDETNRLLEIGGGESGNRQVEIRASKLAKEENKILAEGERALLLLREEGSSAAFPEAVQQMNSDIAKVATRLSDGKVDPFTVSLEEEIVAALEEMVGALVQVQKENEAKKQQRQQQQGPGQSGQQGDQPLVDQLAELRLILTLQKRINKRTNGMSKMLQDPDDVVGQASDAEILSELKELSNRQSDIYRVTRDIQNNALEK
ncbi:MAG: hypothetical protein ACE361_11225 [Aureliella sp.]